MSATPVLVLEPSKGFVRLNLPDVWAYRELLFFLIWRDVKVRYKQTVLGASWAILQPLLTTAIFAVIFLVAVVVQVRAKKFHPVIYWVTIIAVPTR